MLYVLSNEIIDCIVSPREIILKGIFAVTLSKLSVTAVFYSNNEKRGVIKTSKASNKMAKAPNLLFSFHVMIENPIVYIAIHIIIGIIISKETPM